jgi:hypothetical protein
MREQLQGSNCAECPYLNCRHDTTTEQWLECSECFGAEFKCVKASSCCIARWVQYKDFGTVPFGGRLSLLIRAVFSPLIIKLKSRRWYDRYVPPRSTLLITSCIAYTLVGKMSPIRRRQLG